MDRRLRGSILDPAPAREIQEIPSGWPAAEEYPVVTLRFRESADRAVYEKLKGISTDLESDILVLLHVMCDRGLLVGE